MPLVRLVRVVHFSAGHNYAIDGVDASENARLYGELFREGGGFGHNFKVEAHFEGEIDPLTGMIENLSTIDRWLKDAVGPLDHRFLNHDTDALRGFFKTHPPTAENIARFCFAEIETQMTGARSRLMKVRLYEGDNTWVDVSRSN